MNDVLSLQRFVAATVVAVLLPPLALAQDASASASQADEQIAPSQKAGQKGCAPKLRAAYLAYRKALSTGRPYKQYFASERMSFQIIGDRQRQVLGVNEAPVYENCTASGNDPEARSALVFETFMPEAPGEFSYVLVSGAHGLITNISLEKERP